jgi:uncharacterized membrane protein
MESLKSLSYDQVAIAIYSVAAVFCITGFLLFSKGSKRGVLIKERKSFFRFFNSEPQSKTEKSSSDNILGKCYYYIPRDKYNLVTVGVSAMFFLIGALFGSLGFLFFGIAFFALSRPVESYKGIKLPFGKFVSLFHSMEMHKKEDEILESMGILRNMLILQKDNPVGADVVIEQLMQMSDLIRPAFQKLLVSYRLNNHKAAYEGFISEVDTNLGKEYAQLLSSLDLAKPKDLDAVLESYQTHASEAKFTKQKSFDEAISDLIYLPVMINLMIILGNFVLVAYLIDQMSMFGLFF